jgi:predicted ATPase/class 3 adenylate cyclase
LCDPLAVAHTPDPSTPLTFLFTDVEGSTRLWEQHPAEMRSALERHDEILRACIESRDGYVFTTAGDSFAASFGRVDDAVAAAVAVQDALGEEIWPGRIEMKVRVGLHVGHGQERDGDYFGPDVNRAARVMSVAHGGQIIVSRSVVETATNTVRFESRGVHRLKDLSEPRELFELMVEGRNVRFPPLRSLSTMTNNLPVPRTSLIGRDGLVEEVSKLVDGGQLVTLTGPGGAGKTRVAVAAADGSASRFPDGVSFVDLTPLGVGDSLVNAVATAAGVVPPSAPSFEEVLESVARTVASRNLLLVLDNCEHVLDDVAGLCDAILGHGSGARILATSREAIAVEGERVVRVPSLSTSPGATGLSVAAELLIDRAEAAGVDRSIVERATPEIQEIAEALDGIPLALELAAAQLRSMPPSEIVARLDERFDLLAGGRVRGRDRQLTLRAVMDWSWELLDEQEQRLLMILAVFKGTISLDAAESMGRSLLPGSVVALLSRLVDQSLVDMTGTGRYRLLETVRLYGRERLEASGLEHDVQRVHRDHFLGWVESVPFMTRALDYRFARGYQDDLDNIRSSIGWSIEQEQWSEAARLAAAGGLLGQATTYGVELIDLAHLLLAHDLDDRDRLELLIMGMFCAGGHSHHELLEPWAVETAELAAARGLDEHLSCAEHVQGIAIAPFRPDEALELLDRATRHARRAGAGLFEATALGWAGMILSDSGELDEAERMTGAATLLAGDLTYPAMIVEGARTVDRLWRRDYQEVNRLLGARDDGPRSVLGSDSDWYTWWKISLGHVAGGDTRAAWDALATASHHQRRTGGQAGEADLLVIPALAHARAGNTSRAAALISAVRAHPVPTMSFTTTCVFRFVRRGLLDGEALPSPDPGESVNDLLREELARLPAPGSAQPFESGA